MNDASNKKRFSGLKSAAILLVLIVAVMIAGCSLQKKTSTQSSDNQTTNNNKATPNEQNGDMGPPLDAGGTPPADAPVGQTDATPGQQ